MNVLFRADASMKIGTGHIMRCLTLANELKQQGENTTFCCRHLTESLEQTIKASGHQLIRLTDKHNAGSDEIIDQYSAWLETSQFFDVTEVMARIDIADIDWLVVDHYALDICWHNKIKLNNSNIKILVINDLFERSHQCDLFLNQNIVLNGENSYNNLLDENVGKLLGPQFALLRDEFSDYRLQARIRNSGVNTILVFFGGVDVNNTTEKTILALAQLAHKKLSVDVVIGAAHPKIDELKDLCNFHGFKLHIQIENMAELMYMADLSIGASGSASWERCCLGLPSLIISLADNQVAIAEAGDNAGIMSYLGKDEELTGRDITNAVAEMCNNPKRLSRMSTVCFETNDGTGKKRVIEKMRALS